MSYTWQNKRVFIALLFFSVFFSHLSAYELAVCTIFRDDARFLKEWIEFHRLVGIEHFWLYNNLSCDEYAAVLAPYVEEGIVELIEWPYESENWDHWHTIQNSAYEDCIERSKDNTKWLAFIDSDEFLIPAKGESLPALLKSYERYGGVCVNWQLYGTSGVSRVPDDALMVELLTHKAPRDYAENQYIKSIVRPNRVERILTAHTAKYKTGYYHVDENKKRVIGMHTKKVRVDKLRINHYWTRDQEFFFHRKISRRLKEGANISSLLQDVERFNIVEDRIMDRFIPHLKKQIFNEISSNIEQSALR